MKIKTVTHVSYHSIIVSSAFLNNYVYIALFFQFTQAMIISKVGFI